MAWTRAFLAVSISPDATDARSADASMYVRRCTARPRRATRLAAARIIFC
jgi:hypothetical protein